jgi:hypothetical protein
MKYGRKWHHIFQDKKVAGGEKQRITGLLSMQCFGYSEQGLRGEICLQTTEIGKILTEDSVDGGIKGYGRNY